MKLYITTILLAIVSGTSSTFAQIRSNNAVSSTVGGQSVFLDASANGFSGSTNSGKGLAFPRTNLTTFTFVTPTTGALNFPTGYDGMIVYNSGTGNTPGTGSGVGAQAVTPGFYYFSNPTAGPGNYTTAGGRWLPIAGNPKVNFTNSEVATNTLVNNAQVYAIKGQFTATGSSTAVDIPAPTGMTALYGITIYKAGTNTVYDRSLYSYTLATTAGNAITGSPSMSVVYPSGTYDYVIEYLK
ncbi:hypothetical protein EG346_11935 [Chryseobacterium carnipullorum]|uniref:Uncharacterized protein n=1 Tax=Chryseobacterium carnipullorum TaxID=1124835 RepID=A0A376DRR3_CHRCU|nr:hypothetical protein [Chryseobacterium carnipullorum]AZA48841.1 hypothetical protein EG346_11935 [Chryseobacterium carnipullorum]AZA63749.1 hypothetical protein EG345_02845 [Chryseobacterium carnipullorum]STC93332.1 Uncharacterised protein [Chryseobacterium carnipullorum]HBV14177.1 hypothetical protein [Chryseobacterium carnipullorum]